MKKSLFLLTTLLASSAVMADNITFLDPHVKSLCVEKWDSNGDKELSMEEAAAVKSLGDVFTFDTDIVLFPELQYFTGLRTINSSAFNHCWNLQSIQLPQHVTSISTSAFFECVSLEEISIPASVKIIDGYAFNGCTSLASLTLPEGLTTIGDYAFSNCSMSALAIPSTVTKIAQSAFWGCSSLDNITVDPDNTVYDSREDCNAIVTTATNTLSLGTVSTVIPSSVTAIGPYAFYGNSRLEVIDIPGGVTSVGMSAFSGCTSLTSVNLPSTLTTIAYGAFQGCSKLRNIVLPNGLKSIGESAFQRCKYLRKIYIPASVTTIGYSAFDCSNLLKVAVGFETPVSVLSTTFSNRKKATLYVPKGCSGVFKNAETWKEFKTIVELGDNTLTAAVEPEEMVTGQATALTLSLNNDDFYSYRNLKTDITLPDGFFLDANTITPTDRSTGMTITVEPLEENIYRLTCASETAAVTGTEGALFTIGLKADTSVPNGDYQGMASDIVLTDEYGTQQALADAEFSWNYTVAYPMGDVNHDGVVDVMDIVSIVNYILDVATDNFHIDRADMDGDNVIDVIDLIMIIDTDLGVIPLRY